VLSYPDIKIMRTLVYKTLKFVLLFIRMSYIIKKVLNCFRFLKFFRLLYIHIQIFFEAFYRICSVERIAF